MLPFIQHPSWDLGPITIYAFGVIVAVAVFVGLTIGGRRFQQLGLDPRVGERFGGYVVFFGFAGAHLFAVLFYFPRGVADDPLLLLRFWEHISSFGGILGGMIGVWVYFRLKAPSMDPGTRWSYIDVAAYVFPFSLAIGRLGCAMAHDHPGSLTTFPLAVSLESETAQAYIAGVYAAAGRLAEVPVPSTLARLGFHDLGWYELLYLGIVVVPATLVIARKRRLPGTFLASFIALYMPVRFALDFLRVGDVRYVGLTPAQWVALLLIGALPFLWTSRRRRSATGAVLLACVVAQAACFSG
jgi:phosphatidylglycerol:prolipoprotein diacylglycerol transferase